MRNLKPKMNSVHGMSMISKWSENLLNFVYCNHNITNVNLKIILYVINKGKKRFIFQQVPPRMIGIIHTIRSCPFITLKNTDYSFSKMVKATCNNTMVCCGWVF